MRLYLKQTAQEKKAKMGHAGQPARDGCRFTRTENRPPVLHRNAESRRKAGEASIILAIQVKGQGACHIKNKIERIELKRIVTREQKRHYSIKRTNNWLRKEGHGPVNER